MTRTRPVGFRVRTVLAATGAVLAILVVVFGGAVAVGLTVPLRDAHLVTLIVGAVVVQSLATALVLALLLRRAGHSPASIGFSRPTRRLAHVVWQIPLVLVVIVSVQALVFLTTGIDPAGEGSSSDGLVVDAGAPVAVAMFAATAILTPLWEEIFFRGIIHGAARQRIGAVGATLLSSLVFALCHGVPILLPYMAALGICLALLREFHRNLWGPLALHMSVNSIASVALLSAFAA